MISIIITHFRPDDIFDDRVDPCNHNGLFLSGIRFSGLLLMLASLGLKASLLNWSIDCSSLVPGLLASASIF
jgi:hypothetical protein